MRGEDNTDFVDYHIIHPSTKRVNDRPSWLSTHLGRKAFQVTRTLNRMDGGCPCKVAVYNHNELIYGFNKAIPIDIIEGANRQEFTNAYLIAGEGLFTVLSWNKAGKRSLIIIV